MSLYQVGSWWECVHSWRVRVIDAAKVSAKESGWYWCHLCIATIIVNPCANSSRCSSLNHLSPCSRRNCMPGTIICPLFDPTILGSESVSEGHKIYALESLWTLSASYQTWVEGTSSYPLPTKVMAMEPIFGSSWSLFRRLYWVEVVVVVGELTD